MAVALPGAGPELMAVALPGAGPEVMAVALPGAGPEVMAVALTGAAPVPEVAASYPHEAVWAADAKGYALSRDHVDEGRLYLHSTHP